MNLLEFSAGAAILAASVSAGLTLIGIKLSVKLQLIAQPSGDRWHRTATPNTGGMAIVVSSMAVYAALMMLRGGGRYTLVAELGVAMALLGML
ncbi:MAG: hypothetical protein ACRD5L_06160, partial [Bryobacteraceae bacterium]